LPHVALNRTTSGTKALEIEGLTAGLKPRPFKAEY
jgi:hypothetical protein